VATSASVTVIAPDAETADGWATALFVMGPVRGLKLCETLPAVEALFIDADLNVSHSSGFPWPVDGGESP
jgi:thiamine biosynthesis lipoprotein